MKKQAIQIATVYLLNEKSIQADENSVKSLYEWAFRNTIEDDDGQNAKDEDEVIQPKKKKRKYVLFDSDNEASESSIIYLD